MKLYQDREWLYQKYWNEELNQREIGNICGTSKAKIKYWLHKLNVPIRSQSEIMLLKYKYVKENNNRDWLYNKYWNEKLTMEEIGKLCNCSKQCIWRRLKRFNIQVRSSPEARINHCNLSEEAINWINGELLGDGNLNSQNHPSTRFGYASKYREYAQYVLDTLKSFGIKGGKIREQHITDRNMDCYVYKYNSLSYIELSSIRKRWYPEGKKIVPKDLKLTPLTCRQWYIGDGSLYHNEDQRPDLYLATCGFLVKDVEWLMEQLIKLGFKATRRPSNNTIHVSTHSTKQFLDYIGNSPVKCYQYKFDYIKPFQPVLAI